MKGLLVILLSFSFVAFADQIKETNNKAYWLCQHSKNVRTVRVHLDKPDLCVTYYSKYGKEKQIGSGRNLSSCLNFLQNVKNNLEKSGWKCRDISGTTISSAAD